MDSLRLLLLAPEFYPQWGGVGTFVYDLVTHLPQSVEIHVVTPIRRRFGSQRVDVFAYPDELRRNNLMIHEMGVAEDTFLYNAHFQTLVLEKIPSMIKQSKIDIVHAHAAHMPDVFLKILGFKYASLVTIHTTIKHQLTGILRSELFGLDSSERFTLFFAPVLLMLEQLYFRSSKSRTIYVTPSKYMEEHLTNYLKLNPIVIPHGVDLAKLKESAESRIRRVEDELLGNNLLDKNLVLYAGRLLALKGLTDLIRAIIRFSKVCPQLFKDTVFIFAGPGNIKSYQRLLASNGIPEDNYLFLGPVARDEVLALMKVSTILVLPSLVESFGMVLLEAMSLGLPVLACKVGAIPEMVDDGVNGILIPPRAPNIMANRIIQLLNDPDLRNQISKAGKNRAESYDWDRIVPLYMDAYAKLLSICSK